MKLTNKIKAIPRLLLTLLIVFLIMLIFYEYVFY